MTEKETRVMCNHIKTQIAKITEESEGTLQQVEVPEESKWEIMWEELTNIMESLNHQVVQNDEFKFPNYRLTFAFNTKLKV